MPDLLSAGDLTRDRVERLIATARGYAAGSGRRHPGALAGLVFFEDSLRTRVGFEAAAARLGARTTVVLGAKHAAQMHVPETLEDTLRSIESWCDVLLVRHPDLASIAPDRRPRTPVVNCGDREEHPAQALVDVFVLAELLGRVDGLRVGIVGDLHAMRTARSLASTLALFDGLTVRLIAPPGLELSADRTARLREAGHRVDETADLDLDDLDAVYVAGLPAPTRVGILSPEQQARYHVTVDRLAGRPALRVLCPLPRVDEIHPAVDALPQAAYFRAGPLALAMRMAVLDEVLSRP